MTNLDSILKSRDITLPAKDLNRQFTKESIQMASKLGNTH